MTYFCIHYHQECREYKNKPSLDQIVKTKKYFRFSHLWETRSILLFIMEKNKKVTMKGKKSAALQPNTKEKVVVVHFQ